MNRGISCLSTGAITLKNQPDTEKIQTRTSLKFILPLPEGLGSHIQFQRTFFDGCSYCPAGAQALKVAHKKESRKPKGIYLLNHVQNLPEPEQEN